MIYYPISVVIDGGNADAILRELRSEIGGEWKALEDDYLYGKIEAEWEYKWDKKVPYMPVDKSDIECVVSRHASEYAVKVDCLRDEWGWRVA